MGKRRTKGSGISAGADLEPSVELASKTKTGERIKPSPVTLEWLLEGIMPENVHPEADWGPPVGKEIW